MSAPSFREARGSGRSVVVGGAFDHYGTGGVEDLRRRRRRGCDWSVTEEVVVLVASALFPSGAGGAAGPAGSAIGNVPAAASMSKM
jgi:hypothetical protein